MPRGINLSEVPDVNGSFTNTNGRSSCIGENYLALRTPLETIAVHILSPRGLRRLNWLIIRAFVPTHGCTCARTYT